MADDPKKKKHDGLYIGLQQRHERRYWTRAFGVTADTLKTIISGVGRSARAVRDALVRGPRRLK